MAASKKILVVEDDATLRQDLQTVLAASGYEVILSDLTAVGWQLFYTQRPDLVILDLVLPDGDGLELCKKIRGHKELSRTLALMLTGKGGLSEKATGFEAGADQYLAKPVLPQEILLWVQALLRRFEWDTDPGEMLRGKDLEIDLRAHVARFEGQTIADLTQKEFELFCFLVKKRPQALSRKYILSHLWHTITVDHVVDTHLSRIRRKLPQSLSCRIQNVPGVGFRYFE